MVLVMVFCGRQGPENILAVLLRMVNDSDEKNLKANQELIKLSVKDEYFSV